MKIIFLCSSLEPGKDWVRDYCRKLAGSLIASRHEAVIIALNDNFLNAGEHAEKQYDEQKEVRVSSFPVLSCEKKIKKTSAIISAENPDWVSLQYVAYGFDKKGLPFYLPKALKHLTANYKWHIMFHETWIGISKIAPLTHKIYSYFQKSIGKSLIQSIQRHKITTTNGLFMP